MTWTNGNSRTSTPEWRHIRTAALTRAHHQCEQCGAHQHTTRLECDHIIPVAEGGTDTLDNARILCTNCHTPKSKAEAARGQARRNNKRHLPPEPHPGLTHPGEGP